MGTRVGRAGALAVMLLLVAGGLDAAPLDVNPGPVLITPKPDSGPDLPKLKEALEALQAGKADRALALSRELLRDNPGLAPAHQIRAGAALLKGDVKEAEAAANEAMRLQPKSASAMAILAQISLQRNDLKRAEADARRAIAADYTFTPAYRLLAVVLSRQGRLRDAVATAEQGLNAAAGQDAGEDRLLLGGLYFEQGRLADAEQLLARVLTDRPDLVHALVVQGLTKLGLGKVDEAATLLERAVKAVPGSPWGRLGNALVARARGQNARATAELEKLAKDRPDWVTAHMQLGESLLAEKKVDAAIRALDRAEQLSPDKGFARLRTARLLMASGEQERGIARARGALGTPAAMYARALIAEALLAKGDAAGAEKELQAGVAAAPKDRQPLLLLGKFYVAQSKWPDALRQFEQAAKLAPEAPDALLGQVEVRLAMGQGAEAIKTAQQISKLDGEGAEGWTYLAGVQVRAGRDAEARESYERALKKQPGHLAASLGLAALHRREKRGQTAAQVLTEAADANPRSVAPLIELAMLKESEGQVPAALAAYRQVLQREDRNVIALNNLAYRLGQDGKTRDEAVALGERAYQAAPRSSEVADTLGWIYYLRGDMDRAQKLLEQAVGIRPGDPSIRFHLGQVYVRRGKSAEARQQLDAALQNPAFPEVAEARKLRDSLR